MRTSKNSALILSGGGALGAYELGVVKALVNGKSPATSPKHGEAPIPLDPPVLTGTSIGSFNAAYLVSQWDTYGAAAVGMLEAIWLEQFAENSCGNGGYRIRLNPLEVFNPLCFLKNPLQSLSQHVRDSAYIGWDMTQRLAHFASSGEPLLQRAIDLINITTFISTSPWEQVIKKNIDFDALRKSTKSLSIATTNWTTGQVRIFKKAEMSRELGPKVIRASSAIPGFYPPQIMGTQEFVDGGVLMNTPLKPAIAAGGEILHVINMNAKILDVAITNPPSTMETVYRQQLIGWAAALNRDIERVASYNRAIDILEMNGVEIAEMDVPMFLDFLTRKLKTSTELEAKFTFHEIMLAYSMLGKQKKRLFAGKKEKQYKKLTIHRYYPAEPLGEMLSLLNLQAKFFKELFERGFDDAASHDCATCGCILP